ncbi:MAG: sterol desaturase family protein [Xanthomonadales bacterium]|nr:hypothetical protein [Xanthomonadales bacterium]MCC6593607.1 sterol desaturase family protein [Xanthomonadales bacterium]MCE7930325.1 sterol desaturase family protein [Xanthomonadales bacterium PRO6]
MEAWLLAHEGPLRLAVFLGLFALLAGLQTWRPLRGVTGIWRRFGRHLALAALGTLLVRLCFPWLAVAAGAWTQAEGVGLLPWLGAPPALQLLLGVVLLDLCIYWQHRIFHRLPWLWRLHRMHHSDIEFELSTAIRFHPLEIALSMAIKLACVAALGAPPLAVLAFEILLNACSLFSHADLRLSAVIERPLRALLVTPDMHRIHHSVRADETHSNFGFCLSLWDRIFASYRPRASADDATMAIGLERFRGAREQGLRALLMQPLR